MSDVVFWTLLCASLICTGIGNLTKERTWFWVAAVLAGLAIATVLIPVA